MRLNPEEEEKLIKADLSYYRNNKQLDWRNLTNKSPIHPPITLGSNSTSFWELLGTTDQQTLILFQELDPNLINSSVLINSHSITEIPRN